MGILWESKFQIPVRGQPCTGLAKAGSLRPAVLTLLQLPLILWLTLQTSSGNKDLDSHFHHKPRVDTTVAFAKSSKETDNVMFEARDYREVRGPQTPGSSRPRFSQGWRGGPQVVLAGGQGSLVSASAPASSSWLLT